MGVSGQRHAPAALLDRRWMDPKAGLDAEDRRKIHCSCRGSNPGRQVCSQTLYRLSCMYIWMDDIFINPFPSSDSSHEAYKMQHIRNPTLQKPVVNAFNTRYYRPHAL
jgi:hypothetical protein